MVNQIKTEELAYWYLRLNGFLTIPNFVVHPDFGVEQRTDVDVLGVRFPFRAELLHNPMQDEQLFAAVSDRPYLIIAEVKRGRCALNGPWTKPEKKNVHRVLRAIGAFPQHAVSEVAHALYESGMYENHGSHVTLACFGRETSSEVTERYPQIPQIVWDDVLRFVHARFKAYQRQKTTHPQWDDAGQYLWNRFSDSRADAGAFASSVRIH